MCHVLLHTYMTVFESGSLLDIISVSTDFFYCMALLICNRKVLQIPESVKFVHV